MKKLLLTSILIFALMGGLLASMAGTAMAGPMIEPLHDGPVIDLPGHLDMGELASMLEEHPVIPDGGSDECVGCDEDDVVPPDDGIDEGDDEGIDDGGDDEGTDEGSDEGVDEGDDDTGTTDEEQKPPEENTTPPADNQNPPASNTSSGKLPNTGTQLAIIGAIGLLVALTAFAARRAVRKRVR